MATVNLGAIKFNWKGAFNNSTAYAVDDVVSSGGSSYVCILASTGNAVSNGTYWEIMSSAGTNGTDGATIPLTTQGDILFRDGSGLQRLAKGTANQELRINSGATAPEWHTPAVADLTNLSATNLTSGTIPNARYGTPTFNGSNITNLSGFSIGTNRLQCGIAPRSSFTTSWQDLEIDSANNNIGSGVSVSNGDLTLPAGNYYVSGFQTIRNTERSGMQIHNVTDGNDVMHGHDGQNDSSTLTSLLGMSGWFTLSASKVLRFRVYCNSSGGATASSYAIGYSGLFDFWKY